MPDIDKARRAIDSILALPNASKEAKYYAGVALSHLRGLTMEQPTSEVFPDPEDRHAR